MVWPPESKQTWETLSLDIPGCHGMKEARESMIECQQPIDNQSCNDHIRSSEFYTAMFYAS